MKNKTYSQDPAAVAREFSARVLKYIGADNMREVIRLNATADYAGNVCASHDFCDANVFMARAFRAVTGKAINLQDQNHLTLWGNAWSVAKENKFFTVK